MKFEIYPFINAYKRKYAYKKRLFPGCVFTFGPEPNTMPVSLPLNQIQLVGRAGHDVDLHALSDGTPLSRLRLYQDGENRSGEPASSVFMLNAWGTLATTFYERVRRGDTIMVQGRLHIRTFQQGGVQHFRPEVHLAAFYILERTHRRPAGVPATSSIGAKKTSSQL